ncbi:MAG: heparinase II/III-family protein [Planctomycetes bacterium]|nr:heparinase II/III-family protein [Planctomycetota bacterium]
MRTLLFVLLAAAVASAQAPPPLKLTVPKDHPRIGLVSADLEKVRANIAKEPWAGIWKNVVSRSEGVRRGDLDPKRAFGGVGGQGVRFTMTEGLECVALQALVGKDAAAAKALSDFFDAWDPAPLEKDIADTDFMSSGEFFEGLAVVLDWTWDLLTESARTKLRAIVERRAKHNYDGFIGKKSWEATTEANNHSMASMGGLGLAAVALWNENPDAPAWAGMAHAKMKAYLAASFDPDGACYEGTMYGPFGLFRILPFSDCCARFGAGDAMAGLLGKVIAQLANEICPGRDRMLPINDTDGNFLPWGGTLFIYDAARHESPLSRWMWTDLSKRQAGNGGHTWAFAVLWEDGKEGGNPPDKLVAVTKGRGTLTVRTGWEKADFLAAFECGKRVPGCHGQSDVGHFLIYAKGKCLAADTGYSNEAEEGKPQQSIGHNLVLVDGKGEVLTGGGQVTEGKLVQWEERKTLVWTQADLTGAFAQKAYNPMAVATRCFIVLTGPDPYVVVADAFVKDAKDHDYTWLLHGNADSKFDCAKDRATHQSGDAALDIVPCLFDKDVLAFETKKFPSSNFGEHDMLRATVKGKRWLGLTVLSPRGASDAAADVKREIKGGKLVVTVTRGGAKDEFTLTAAPNGGIGSLRVVRTIDGKSGTEDLKLK